MANDVKELALLGIKAKIQVLETELTELKELEQSMIRQAVIQSRLHPDQPMVTAGMLPPTSALNSGVATDRDRRGEYQRTPEFRAAARKRMKKYWAMRRKEAATKR